LIDTCIPNLAYTSISENKRIRISCMMLTLILSAFYRALLIS